MPKTLQSYRRRVRALTLVAAALYIGTLSLYGYKVYQEESKWKAQRQEQISLSPAVYVTPHGEKYHRGYHYSGRTTPLSLYEATEQDYGACRVCNPPSRATLLSPPAWYIHHWLVLGLVYSAFFGVTYTALLGRTSFLHEPYPRMPAHSETGIPQTKAEAKELVASLRARLEAAQSEIDDLAYFEFEDVEDCIASALDEWRLGNRQEAYALYSQAIKWHPDHAVALLNRGNLQIEMGMFDDGIEDLEKARALDPTLPCENATLFKQLSPEMRELVRQSLLAKKA